MHLKLSIIILFGLCVCDASAQLSPEHQAASAALANRQDELSADVQQLTIEQTAPPVITLLKDVRATMNEATDQLLVSDTSGTTIAAQTEIIEKIHAAAHEKQKQQGGSASSGAMMDMMERMMGKKSDAPEKGQNKEGQAGDQAGQGGSGPSKSTNVESSGMTTGKDETRRIQKASGQRSTTMPEEFQQALDAYNRGAEKLQ